MLLKNILYDIIYLTKREEVYDMVFNNRAFEKIKTYKKLCTKIYIEKSTSKSNLKKLNKIEKQLQKNNSVDYNEILRLKNFIERKAV